MGWLGRSLGQFGSDIGGGYDISQQWKQREQQMALENARQKIAQMMLPLQIQEIQARLKQMTQPKPEGIVGLPGGGTGGATFDPNTGKYGMQPLVPGMDAAQAKMQIGNMAKSAPKEYQAALNAYADSIDAGEDPQKALEKANALMGTSATHQTVTGRLVKGDPIPDKNSVTGYSRPMYDGLGNLVKVVPNIVIPGLMPKETEGWQVASDTDGNVYMVPKTTVTKPVGPGAHASVGGGQRVAGTQASPDGSTTTLPPGARPIGSKSTDIQKDAVKASKDARDAYSVLNVAKGDYKDAKAGNPKASLALVFSAVRSMVAGAGRMTNVEIEQELKAGSLDQRLERWYTQAVSGTMPTDQMDFIMQVIQNAYEGKRQSGEQAWRYAYPGKPLQPWLRGEVPENAPPKQQQNDLSDLGGKPAPTQ